MMKAQSHFLMLVVYVVVFQRVTSAARLKLTGDDGAVQFIDASGDISTIDVPKDGTGRFRMTHGLTLSSKAYTDLLALQEPNGNLLMQLQDNNSPDGTHSLFMSMYHNGTLRSALRCDGEESKLQGPLLLYNGITANYPTLRIKDHALRYSQGSSMPIFVLEHDDDTNSGSGARDWGITFTRNILGTPGSTGAVIHARREGGAATSLVFGTGPDGAVGWTYLTFYYDGVLALDPVSEDYVGTGASLPTVSHRLFLLASCALVSSTNTTQAKETTLYHNVRPGGDGNHYMKSNGTASALRFNADGSVRVHTYPDNVGGSQTTPQERLTVLNNGNVGINSTSPSSTLEVDGRITAKSLEVNGVDVGDTLSALAGGTYVPALTYQFGGDQVVVSDVNGSAYFVDQPFKPFMWTRNGNILTVTGSFHWLSANTTTTHTLHVPLPSIGVSLAFAYDQVCTGTAHLWSDGLNSLLGHLIVIHRSAGIGLYGNAGVFQVAAGGPRPLLQFQATCQLS